MDFEINQRIHYLDQNGNLQPATIYSKPLLSRNNGNRKTPNVSYQVLNKRNNLRKILLQWILDGEAAYIQQRKEKVVASIDKILGEYGPKIIEARLSPERMVDPLLAVLRQVKSEYKPEKEQS